MDFFVRLADDKDGCKALVQRLRGLYLLSSDSQKQFHRIDTGRLMRFTCKVVYNGDYVIVAGIGAVAEQIKTVS